MTNVYVISVKRVKDYNCNDLKKEDQYYEYLGIDRYTGYPCFLGDNCCKTFSTVEKAKEFFEECFYAIKKYLDIEGSNCYDVSTLGVRQKIVKYKKQCRLEYLKG